MPADTQIATVRIAASDAVSSERMKALGMSPIRPVPDSSCWNHSVECPTIGKLIPPFGPWNDRMKMTIIGP